MDRLVAKLPPERYPESKIPTKGGDLKEAMPYSESNKVFFAATNKSMNNKQLPLFLDSLFCIIFTMFNGMDIDELAINPGWI